MSSLPPGPVVKVCGLTRVDDVVLAAELGAWALGFVFAPSPRRLTPAGARALIGEAVERLSWVGGPSGPAECRLPLTVGVFTDATAAEIARVVRTVGLDVVQLHAAGGDGAAAAEVRAALAAQARSASEAPGGAVAQMPLIIQAVAVDAGEAASREAAAAIRDAVAAAGADADIVLLDSKVAGHFGGTGTAFAWQLAREAVAGTPLLVAGGITTDNAAAALEGSGAWGVDVSSGVELSPGLKDPERLARLFANTGGRVTAPVWPRARAGVAAGAGATSPLGAAARARGADRIQEG